MSAYDNHTVNLTITVLDTATIFEGPESIYRYNLPGTAIVEGTAISGLMEQIKKLFPAQWPDIRVVVVADSSGGPMSHEAVKIIRRQLRVHDAHVVEPALTPAITPFPVEEESPEDDYEFIRPTPPRESIFQRFKYLIAAGAMAVLIVLIIVGWIFSRAPAQHIATEPVTEAVANTHVMSTPTPTPTATTKTSTPTTVSIEAGGLRVQLPEGFSHVEEDGLVTATGADPNLRIIMVMDPLYAVPREHALRRNPCAH